MLHRMLSSLLTRIVVAIVLGALCGLFFPEPIARIFVTFKQPLEGESQGSQSAGPGTQEDGRRYCGALWNKPP